MNPAGMSRIAMGTFIMGGLLFYEPLSYAGAGMMILSGVTGI